MMNVKDGMRSEGQSGHERSESWAIFMGLCIAFSGWIGVGCGTHRDPLTGRILVHQNLVDSQDFALAFV